MVEGGGEGGVLPASAQLLPGPSSPSSACFKCGPSDLDDFPRGGEHLMSAARASGRRIAQVQFTGSERKGARVTPVERKELGEGAAPTRTPTHKPLAAARANIAEKRKNGGKTERKCTEA